MPIMAASTTPRIDRALADGADVDELEVGQAHDERIELAEVLGGGTVREVDIGVAARERAKATLEHGE